MSSRLEHNVYERVAVAPSSFSAASPNVTSSTMRNWLPFNLVAPATAAIDFFIITLTSLISGIGYHWLVLNTSADIYEFLALGALVFANFSALTTARQNYRPTNLINVGRQIRFATLNWLFIFAVLTVLAFTLKISANFSRGAALTYFALGWAGLAVFRIFVGRNLKRAIAVGAFAEQTVALITERGHQISSRALEDLTHCGYKPIKTFELSLSELEPSGSAKSWNEEMRQVVTTCQNEAVDYIFLLMSWHNPRAIDNILRMLRVLPIPVHLLPDQDVGTLLAARPGNLGTAYTVELQRAPLTKTEQAVKRAVDIILAAMMLTLLSPLMLLTALLIKLDSSGPVLFRQRRNGFNGSTFMIYKFRSMRVLEDGERYKQATRNDPRVTRLGRWLRQTSIDELPQLINVLKADMSLVGPRPHPLALNTEYQEIISDYAFRHHVKPGITGWAQVNGFRGETQTVDSMAKRVEYDLWYINHWSFWLDLRILLKTMLSVYRQPMAY